MRAKILFPNLLALLVMGIVGYVFLNISMSKRADADLEANLKLISGLFDRSEALRGQEQLGATRRLSMSRIVTDVFRESDVEQMEDESDEDFERRIRENWFRKTVKAVEQVAATLSIADRKPALVFLTDRNGVVLARNTTPNACPAGRNAATGMSVVQKALDGEASYSLWSVEGSPFDRKGQGTEGHQCSLISTGLLEFSASPIWGDNDQIAGALGVGFEVSNGAAAEKATALGIELSVIQAGRVYSTSFRGDPARESLNQFLEEVDINEELDRAFSEQRTSSVFRFEIDGNPYLAVALPVSDSEKADRVGYLFSGSVANARRHTGPLYGYLLIILAGAILVTVIGIILGNHFMKPVLAIEEGLLKMINGEYEYRFDVESDEVGGLGYRINQLVNVLTEQEESSEDDA